MNKKIWAAPEIGVVQFAANACIAGCEDQYGYLYKFQCDAVNDYGAWVAFDTNASTGENGQKVFNFDSTGSWSAWNDYQKSLDDEETFSRAGMLSFLDTNRNNYTEYDQFIANDKGFRACDEKHEAASSSIFWDGWLVYPKNGEPDLTNPVAATIWTGNGNDNIHATFKLGVENIEVTRS